MAERENEIELTQVDRFRFEARFEGSSFGPLVVDEGPPTGGGAGPNPAQSLAVAVGHCMSSTLVECLRRARIPVRRFSTRVRPVFGRNPRGRLRVVRLEVTLAVDPMDEADRERMQNCLAIFEDLCPVTGAVREGAQVVLTVAGPGSAAAGSTSERST